MKPLCTVKPGDTLWQLAKRHLGSPHRWPELLILDRSARVLGRPWPATRRFCRRGLDIVLIYPGETVIGPAP